VDARERDGPKGEREHVTAPTFGGASAAWAEVQAFYSHWGDFISVLSFSWEDEYREQDAPSRSGRHHHIIIIIIIIVIITITSSLGLLLALGRFHLCAVFLLGGRVPRAGRAQQVGGGGGRGVIIIIIITTTSIIVVVVFIIIITSTVTCRPFHGSCYSTPQTFGV
jgi:hypothetical protein